MNLQDSRVQDGNVSPANRKFYQGYGYLVAPGLLGPAEIAELKAEAAQIFRGQRGSLDGLVPVGPDASDAEVLKKYVAIHFPHKISPLIHRYLAHPRVVHVLTRIVGPNVKCMQSMLFVKAPGKAGQSWHQDEFFIPTRDRSLVGAWIAVDDATVENGCLWLIPGSQHPAYLWPRVPNDNPEYADQETIDVTGFPAARIVPVEVKSGSVVFFNGYTLHSSRRNQTADNFRTALVNHYMSAESLLPWDQGGHVPFTEDLRDIVLVAGTDPYAYKGTVDLSRPHLRPEVLKAKPVR